MKKTRKTFSVAFVVILMFFTVACTDSPPQCTEIDSTEDDSLVGLREEFPLMIITEYDEYPNTVVTINGAIRNPTEQEQFFGMHFVLERQSDNCWEIIPYKDNGGAFSFATREVQAESDIPWEYNIATNFDLPLIPGVYRISHGIFEEQGFIQAFHSNEFIVLEQ
jgi:hypothetical protein